MPHHCPARSESKDQNETIRTLKAENRRLRKLLQEARRAPPDSDSEAFTPSDELSPQLPRPIQHPLSCACSRESPEKVRQIDFLSHILFCCTICDSRKSIKRRLQ